MGQVPVQLQCSCNDGVQLLPIVDSATPLRCAQNDGGSWWILRLRFALHRMTRIFTITMVSGCILNDGLF